MQTIAPERRTADAFDRVLEAEHVAREAIAAAQSDAALALQLAREQSRAILESARRRVVAVHDRTQRRIDAVFHADDTREERDDADPSMLEHVLVAAVDRVSRRLIDETGS